MQIDLTGAKIKGRDDRPFIVKIALSIPIVDKAIFTFIVCVTLKVIALINL